jgi:energy-coupling factor transporter ATP-binding protein EcfA2
MASSTGSIATHWAQQSFTVTRVEDALALLQEPSLLASFFDRLLEVLTLIEANESTLGFDTSLAWDMIERGTANVLVYGESGAGKSTLVRTITGDEGAKSSATTVGTTQESIYRTPSGICFIDTPGIKIPLVEEADASYFRYLRDRYNWNAMLADLNRRLRSPSAETRPLGVVYVHRVTMRVIPERIADLVSKSHRLLVPTFIVLSDVCSVDDDELKEVRERITAIADELGPNARNHRVQVVEVNTQTKIVSGHRHPSRGLPELLSKLLSHLDPMDALTFTRRTFMRPVLLPERQKQRVRAALLARHGKRPRDTDGDEDGDEDGSEAADDELEERKSTPATRRQKRA